MEKVDREAEINKKIQLLKEKNEKLLQRHQEIEADKKQAEKHGRSVNVRNQQSDRHSHSHKVPVIHHIFD